MALTKIQSGSFETGAIDTSDLSSNATIAFSSTSAFANALAPKITTVNVANSAFTVLDDTAVNVGGGYIVITGANFQSGASVLIDTTPASAVTFVNTSTLQVQIPAKAAASYNLYVVNPDGGTGIKVAGLNYSTNPTWVTSSPLSNQAANIAFNVNFSATGATSYAVAAGSTLPAGTSLLANGYFSGTVSIGAQTTYTFDVVATDAENQDSSKTFQVTVTTGPPPGLYAWGSNAYGMLGFNNAVYKSSPTQVGTETNWSKISISGGSSLGVKTDGTLWAWGYNADGQLGQNDTVNRSSPTQVGSQTNWSQTALSGFFAAAVFAIKTDGTLWSWGENAGGKLGTSNTVPRSSPVQVGANANWSQIRGVTSETIGALKTDGTLWTWGYNDYGQLGTNTVNITASSPVQVAGSNWSQLSSGTRFHLAIKTDGTLWAWGRNFAGQLGNNDASNLSRSSPVQIGSSTNWGQLCEVSNYGGRAVKTDGTLWVWGRGDAGQLGLNTTDVDKISPTQVGSSTDWSKAYAMNQASIAIKTNGTLWVWGYNNGNFGTNDIISRSSPVQVGTATNWNTILSSHSAVFAIMS